MDQYLPLGLVVGWFGAIFVVSFLINWLLVRSVIRNIYRYFVAPGVIVHEFSHAIGCLATGAHIVEINFWKTTGGHVKHYQPKIPLIGEAIIALAPIAGSLAALAILTWWLMPEIAELLTDNKGITVANIIKELDVTNLRSWIYLYAVTSLLATMAPSKSDIHYALASLITIGVLLGLLSNHSDFHAAMFSFVESMTALATFYLILTLLAFGFAALLAMPIVFLHRDGR